MSLDPPKSYSSSEDDDDNIRKLADVAGHKSVPKKSEKRYEFAYKTFMNWYSLQNHTKFDQDVFLAYFNVLSKKHKAPATLWSTYSMLKKIFRVNHNIDLKKFCILIEFIKQVNKGYSPTKANVFTSEQCEKFIAEAEEKIYLIHKVRSF